MSSAMKTLFLNPPSFEKFDGGAGSRWPATREIESYWYPVWLAYPAGMLQGSRLLDGPPHHITPEEVIRISADYEFLVLFTSTVGFQSDIRMARAMKEKKPDLKIAFVGPQVQIKPAESLLASQDIDFVVRGEFDHAVVDYAQGKQKQVEKNLVKSTSKEQTASIPACVTDSLSAIFYAASQPMVVGQTIRFPLADSMRTVTVTMKVEAKEEIKTPAGTFQTIRVEPTADEGVVKNRGNIWVWYTDDARHIPVQIQARLFWGTITFHLQSLEMK